MKWYSATPFAMVDEVDSVLIDDARTPLIIKRSVGHSDNTQQFFDLNQGSKNWLMHKEKLSILF